MWYVGELDEEYITTMEDVLKFCEKPLSKSEPVRRQLFFPLVLPHSELLPNLPEKNVIVLPRGSMSYAGRSEVSVANWPTSCAASNPRRACTSPGRRPRVRRPNLPISSWRSL